MIMPNFVLLYDKERDIITYIYIFIYFKSEYPYNKFTVIERILENLQNSYIETGAHKVRLKLKYSTKNLKSKIKIPNK